jgi:hypothetical protein
MPELTPEPDSTGGESQKKIQHCSFQAYCKNMPWELGIAF